MQVGRRDMIQKTEDGKKIIGLWQQVCPLSVSSVLCLLSSVL